MSSDVDDARHRLVVAGQADDSAAGAPGSPTGSLVVAARRVAEDLLAPSSGTRWAHTQAVAARAAQAVHLLSPADGQVLTAAAWLHDIGYTPALHDSGFHPLDGARYLSANQWPDVVAGLVAHHSGARFVAEVRGIRGELALFSNPAVVTGPLADALTWADQTTGPTGEVMDVEERLRDMLRRHGPESPNARCHAQRAPALRAAVRATQARLQAHRRLSRHGGHLG